MDLPEIIKLNRYTSIPILLDLLSRKKLVLLDPGEWEDKNDSEVLMEYKRRKNINGLCALCFSYGDETIHQWKNYADGISGCCIEFSYDKLMTYIKKHKEVVFKYISYKTIKEVKKGKFEIDEMPFTKRQLYSCEEEYRIIWLGKDETQYYEIEINLDCINKITISQKMPKIVYETIKDLLKKSFIDPKTKIYKSTVFKNEKWIDHFKTGT